MGGRERVVYFSSATQNTKRFVEKVGVPAQRIPLRATDPALRVDYDYVLITPTYGGGTARGAVPKQVIHFLNVAENRAHCLGVISSGNANFGSAYALAGDIVAAKLRVPLFYRFELLGTPDDVRAVREGLRALWQRTATARA